VPVKAGLDELGDAVEGEEGDEREGRGRQQCGLFKYYAKRGSSSMGTLLGVLLLRVSAD
jgi:hypothetical protein